MSATAEEISDFFGLEMLKNLFKTTIKKKEDHLVLAVHWLLIKNGFRCIGRGDAREIAGDEIQSELLPEDWNADSSAYLLRYMYSSRCYILRVSYISDNVMLNFIKADDMKVSCFVINGTELSRDGLTQEQKTLNNIYKEMISTHVPAAAPPAPTTPTQRIYQLPDTSTSYGIYGAPRRPQPDFRDVGRQDLDPFASGPNAGMLMGIPGVGRPLVRYDPINPEQGPLGPRGRFPFGSNPDHDEFMPPGQYFM